MTTDIETAISQGAEVYLSDADVAHLKSEYARLIAPYRGLEEYGINDGPEAVMTSVGYVNLCTDGEIYVYGNLVDVDLDVDSIGQSERPDLAVLVDANVPEAIWPIWSLVERELHTRGYSDHVNDVNAVIDREYERIGRMHFQLGSTASEIADVIVTYLPNT